MQYDDVEIKNYIETRIPEYEILLSFTDDCDAEAFTDWWFSIGRKQFIDWCNMPEFDVKK